MKNFYFLVLCCIAGNICTAQNLVSNGSFENYLNVPTGSGQCFEAVGWKSAGGSPDYFHEFSSTGSEVNIPYTFAGNLTKAHEGIACAGISSFMKGIDNFREYLTYKLDSSIVAGQTYSVSLYCLSNTNPVYYGGIASDNLGVAFSKKKLHKNSDGVIHYTPQCALTSQFYSYSWKKLSFEFVADSAYKYITIGCFVDDNTQQRQFVNSALLFECVYTFIDDVSVVMKKNTITTAVARINYNDNNEKVTYTDILGRPVTPAKGLLIAKKGNKYERVFIK